MRSVFSKFLVALACLFALSFAGGQQHVNPHTNITWPTNCVADQYHIYNQLLNTCISIGTINPGAQITWPGTCTSPTQVYVPATNSCIANGTAANPAGSANQLQFNSAGVFGGTTGITYDGASGLGIGGAVVAASLNTVLDLKGKFGASGSQATMSCTATASSNTLTGCTGGDFKVGQWVFLPSMGITTTTSTPAAPTLACVSHSGGSCTGTTVYGYRIMAGQAYPNGPLTPAGTAQTITQATQIMQQITNSGNPDVGTTVSGYAVANASYYAVYKSINGGPYNFYTWLGSSSFTDYGYMSSSGVFTCAQDTNLPCVAPSAATPNDVYALITAISGGTVTLAALPNPPKYFATNGLASAFFPSTPSQSGTVIVQHDDTPAFVAAYIYLAAQTGKGQLEVHMPAGSYNVHNADPYGGIGVIHLNNLNNVQFVGDGDATKIYGQNDRTANGGSFVQGACGASHSPPGNCVNWAGIRGGGTGFNVVDPVPAGALSVTLSVPANAANFPAGQYVTIFTLGTPYPADTYGEMNLVTSSNSTTGVVTLAYPTNKLYSATLPALYSTGCTACAAQPQIGLVNPQPVATHIKLKNFWYRGNNIFANFNAIDDFEESGLTVIAGKTETQGFTRHRLMTNNSFTEDGFFNSQTLLANAAVGSGDYTVTNNQYFTNHGSSTGQPCSEGSVNEVFANNIYHLSGLAQNPAGQGAFMGMGATCWGLAFLNNNVTITNNSLVNVITANDPGGSATFTGNQFNLDNVSITGSTTQCVQSQALTAKYSKVYNNTWNITGSGTCYKINGSGTTMPSVDSIALTGQTGAIAIYPYYGSQTIFNIGMTGNLSAVNLGSVHIPGYMFALNFQQDATGGRRIPATCLAAQWGMNIDCINGTPMLINNAANSNTFVWFYDDGTILHELWTTSSVTQSYSTFSLGSLTGNIALYPYYAPQAKVLAITMSGNITQINMGSIRWAGTYFAIAFTQDATGNRTLPADCLDAHWATNGSGVDCPVSPPVVNPAASSTTYLWFYDDGTTLHFLSSNYTSTSPLAAQYKIRTCGVGLGDGTNAIPAGTYTLKFQCRNLYGSTFTITGVQCASDNNGTSTGNVADSAANALLTGAVTATSSWAAGTQSGTTTLASNIWTNWTIVADGTSKQVQCTLKGTI